MSDMGITNNEYEQFMKILFGFKEVHCWKHNDEYGIHTAVRLTKAQLRSYCSLSADEIKAKLLASQIRTNYITNNQNGCADPMVVLIGDTLIFSGHMIAAKEFFKDIFICQ